MNLRLKNRCQRCGAFVAVEKPKAKADSAPVPFVAILMGLMMLVMIGALLWTAPTMPH